MTNKERTPRDLKTLIKAFQNSAGDFERFNDSMDEREFVLFKGWLASMRREIPKFAYHGEDSN
jgi:hypothetical protein